MNDKNLMEDLLACVKNACDLFVHGAIESSTPTLHSAFTSALNTSLCMQNDIYNAMSKQGWYAPDPAPQEKINALKQRFSAA